MTSEELPVFVSSKVSGPRTSPSVTEPKFKLLGATVSGDVLAPALLGIAATPRSESPPHRALHSTSDVERRTRVLMRCPSGPRAPSPVRPDANEIPARGRGLVRLFVKELRNG